MSREASAGGETCRERKQARVRKKARSVAPQDTPPLVTTEPRHSLSAPSAPMSIAPTSSLDSALSGSDTLVAAPSSDHSTPSGHSQWGPVRPLMDHCPFAAWDESFASGLEAVAASKVS